MKILYWLCIPVILDSIVQSVYGVRPISTDETTSAFQTRVLPDQPSPSSEGFHPLSNEKSRTKEITHESDFSESPAWQLLKEYYGDKITYMELMSVAKIVAGMLGLKLGRGQYRRKFMLIRWFDKKLHLIAPLLPSITLSPSHYQN
ncbi:MAG: hypothetical protein LBI30_00940 [Holosporales bacterium]|jgi:hypothetical protein|nr:hypothetical protein [Holosporales bacterium]